MIAVDTYRLQAEANFKQALEAFRISSAGFADALITVESRAEQLALWTFDQKLSKQAGAVRLTEQSLAKF